MYSIRKTELQFGILKLCSEKGSPVRKTQLLFGKSNFDCNETKIGNENKNGNETLVRKTELRSETELTFELNSSSKNGTKNSLCISIYTPPYI